MTDDEEAFVRWLERKARLPAARSEADELDRQWAEFGLKLIRRLVKEKAHE